MNLTSALYQAINNAERGFELWIPGTNDTTFVPSESRHHPATVVLIVTGGAMGFNYFDNKHGPRRNQTMSLKEFCEKHEGLVYWPR